MFDYLIKNGQLIDGTGSPARRADVGITDGKIAAIGDLSAAQAGTVIDAAGKTVTPGFIDIHRHADAALFRPHFGELELKQGLTTIVNGNCGLATVAFGVVISWSGFIFISQCLEFNMNIIRCVSVPRWLVESCVGLGMAMFTVFAVYRLWGVVRDKHAPEAAEPEE